MCGFFVPESHLRGLIVIHDTVNYLSRPHPELGIKGVLSTWPEGPRGKHVVCGDKTHTT